MRDVYRIIIRNDEKLAKEIISAKMKFMKIIIFKLGRDELCCDNAGAEG
jgi:hypothetical protein